MEQQIFVPLFRLDFLIEDKALKDKVHPSKIIKELTDTLGLSARQIRNIRSARHTDSGFLKSADLITLSSYFSVTIDELFNPAAKDLLTPVTNPDA